MSAVMKCAFPTALGVANGNSCVPVEQQHCHGLAHDVASADNHAVLAVDLHAGAVNEFHDTRRCAGEEVVVADHDLAHVYGVECVHIFQRGNGLDDQLFIEVIRQRHLYQNAVYLVVLVQHADQIQQLFFRCVFV